MELNEAIKKLSAAGFICEWDDSVEDFRAWNDPDDMTLWARAKKHHPKETEYRSKRMMSLDDPLPDGWENEPDPDDKPMKLPRFIDFIAKSLNGFSGAMTGKNKYILSDGKNKVIIKYDAKELSFTISVNSYTFPQRFDIPPSMMTATCADYLARNIKEEL